MHPTELFGIFTVINLYLQHADQCWFEWFAYRKSKYQKSKLSQMEENIVVRY